MTTGISVMRDSLALTWAVQASSESRDPVNHWRLSPNPQVFPIGMAMNKNPTLNMGNCNHRKYIPTLVDMVRSGKVAPKQVLTQVEPLTSVIDAYKAFDTRQPGWIKVELGLGAS